MDMSPRSDGIPKNAGFLLRLHILPSHFGNGFVKEFGPDVFTFFANLKWPLPQVGTTLVFAGHKKLREAQVVFVTTTPQRDIDLGLTSHRQTVDARVVGTELIDIKTMYHLMYTKGWKRLETDCKLHAHH